jgi:hypothetical protein
VHVQEREPLALLEGEGEPTRGDDLGQVEKHAGHGGDGDTVVHTAILWMQLPDPVQGDARSGVAPAARSGHIDLRPCGR